MRRAPASKVSFDSRVSVASAEKAEMCRVEADECQIWTSGLCTAEVGGADGG